MKTSTVNGKRQSRIASTPGRSASSLADRVADSARQMARYQVPSRPRRSVSLDDNDLPANYDQTRLTLLSRDPHFLHAYWEIAPADVQAMQQKIGSDFDRSAYTLRMHDVTAVNFNGQNANQSFDIDIAPHINNWYINLWQDNANFCGQIGMRTPEGKFYPYTQSNVTGTPRDSASGRSDMIWMDVKENREDAFVFTWPRARRVAGALANQGAVKKFQSSRKIFITEDDIRAYYASLYPLLSKVRKWRLNGGNGNHALDWMNAANREQVGDAFIPGISKSEYYKEYRLGASAELLEKGGASEQIFSGASDVRPVQQGRQFFFEIWTELIVHGRTEADASVELNKRPVKLRKDGTFTLRYALPDGRIPLDFAAISHDRQETRKITTAAERMRTIYSP